MKEREKDQSYQEHISFVSALMQQVDEDKVFEKRREKREVQRELVCI